MNVYVVQQGCYSDCGVCGVFSSQAAANEWIAVRSSDPVADEYDVTEYVLDDLDGEWRKHLGLHPYMVTMFEREWRSWDMYSQDYATYGNTLPAGSTARRVTADDLNEAVRPYGGTTLDLYPPGADPRDWLITECWARDEDHAIKIAADRRAAYVASNPQFTWMKAIK